ncbi:MAG: ATP-binding response regulator [Candidatus Acidiferrales bacterium]
MAADKINVLMVDDQPSRLLTYEAMLADLGENLIRAGSVDEALDCLLRNEVAVVLTDVNMPGLGGFDLADSMRGHPRFQNTAIIFISGAHITDTDRLKGYDHGAVDYLFIPVIPELLRAKVRVFADLYRKTRKLEMLNADMQRVSARMIAAQDDERRRIARELHDGLGQELTLVKLLVDSLHSPDARAGEASQAIEAAMQQIRSISHLLHPPLLDELGLESAVRWYVQGLSRRSGIETSLELEPAEFPRLPAAIENAVYRIIQEALTNVFRHAGAKNACVTLKCGERCVAVSVRDNGKGIPEEIASFKPGSLGVGVGGMRQRVKEFGGELKLINADPGTLLEVTIPHVAAEAHSLSASTR